MESFLTSAGYAALILFGFLEAACIPISSEITFGFAGVLAYQGHLNLALVIIIGSLAELAGSYASYAVGRVGGRPLVDKLGRYVLVTQSDVDRAERFLAGRGSWAIVVGRMLPFVRAFTSIVAGLIRVPAVRFGVLSAIGTVLYATALSLDRLRARQRLEQRQPRPDRRRVHPVRARGRGHRRLRGVPAAPVPAGGRAGRPGRGDISGRGAGARRGPAGRAAAAAGRAAPVRFLGRTVRRRRGTRFRELPRGPARPG